MPDPLALLRLIEEGGTTMPALVAAALVLWYGLGRRMLALRRRDRRSVDALWREALAGRLSEGGPLRTAAVSISRRIAGDHRSREREESARIAVDGLVRALGHHRTLVQGLCFLAPLLGLLGTVSGMIETFDALGQQAMFRQSGGIAGGISEALLTTQLGLCVAIPGTLVGRLLDRKEDHLRHEIDELVDLAVRGEAA